MDKNYKILIPKYLTYARIILTTIIILLGIMKLNLLMCILTILASLTSIGDTILNKLWKVSSNKRTKIDLFADKIFVLGITCYLMFKYHILITIFILELIISIINIYFFYKKKKIHVINLGKYKLTSYIICLILFILNNMKNILTLCNGFSYITINLQLLSILEYVIYFIDFNKPTINNNSMHREIMKNHIDNEIMNDLDKTKVLDNINNLDKKIYDVENDI